MPAKKTTSADKGFLLRIDAQTMAAIERWAAEEFRSINGQLQWIIADSLRRHHRRPISKDSNDSDEKNE